MIKGKNIKKYFSFIFKLLCYIVLFFVCLLCVFLVYYIISSQVNANNEDYKPKISLYTIVSPSMTPVIDVYDIVVNVRPNSQKDIEVGDIITYKSKAPNSEGMTITHRVVSIIKNEDGKTEYITQGDNNENPDSIYVDYDSIIGEEILIIPKIGKFQFLIAEQKGWLFLLLIPVAIIVFKDAYRLIELFGLKRKVDKVAGYVESSALDKKKQEEQIRKEKLKKQLEDKHITKDSRTKSSLEPKGFLEEYTETVVKVDKNRYKKSKSTIKEESKVEEQKVEEIKIEEKPIVKKEKPVIIYEQFEILDTDELTTKIKEYDEKISELDKMLKDLENTKVKVEEQKEEFIEENDYLKESKIKVVKVEETKNKKNPTRKKKEELDTTTKIDVIEIKSLIKKDQVEKINITNKKTNKKGLVVIEKNRNDK